MRQNQTIKLHQEQEFVIGGYTEPQGARKHFGALLVGFYEARNLNLLPELEPASAKSFCALYFYSPSQTTFGLKTVPFLTCQQLAGALGTKG